MARAAWLPGDARAGSRLVGRWECSHPFAARSLGPGLHLPEPGPNAAVLASLRPNLKPKRRLHTLLAAVEEAGLPRLGEEALPWFDIGLPAICPKPWPWVAPARELCRLPAQPPRVCGAGTAAGLPEAPNLALSSAGTGAEPGPLGS